MSAAAYERAIENLSVGDTVTGKVICRAHFGAWVDIGNGFPALLEIIHLAGLKPSDYKAGNWCAIGSELEATILAFSGEGRQVRLTQKE
jgi:ribosomal protein S1